MGKETFNTNTEGHFDLIIIGGGPSGLSAAVNAGRLGLSVAIVEKNGFFGGMNVAGLSGTIGGLYSSSDDPNEDLKQIVNGFAGEFVRELKKRNGILPMVRFGNTALSPHDPLIWKEVADNMIISSKVTTYFHTWFSDVYMENDSISGIIAENKSGRFILKAERFIDASGDGDFAFKSDVECRFGDKGKIQAMTMVFRMDQVEWNDVSTYSLNEIWEILDRININGAYDLPRTHPFIFPMPIGKQALMNCSAIISKDNKMLYPTNSNDLTYAEFEGRRLVREYERFFKDNIKGFENAYVTDTACQIGVRQSRSIKGVYTLTNQDVMQARKFPNAIARSAWPIEVHQGKDGVKIFNLDNDYYEIPFEVLIPEKVDKMLVVGRCISAEHEALASARVVAQCFEEGMAAAIAMKQSLEQSMMPRFLDVNKIRKTMIDYGSYL